MRTRDSEVKGVTTRGGKTTTQDDHDNNTNVLPKGTLVVEPEKPVGPNDVFTNDQPRMTSEPVVQPSNEVQTPPVPFPRRLRKEKEETQQKKFLENLKQLHINLPFIEALAQMPKYAKFLKGLLTNKARLEEACKIIMNERCSTVLLNKLPSKEKDPGSFTIPCDIGQLHIDNVLADLGASINLMPYTMYKKLGLGEPKATRMSLELADRSIQYPRGIIENVLIKVDKFILPIDFVILDMLEDSRVPRILGRPFLGTARAMIDIFNKKITLRVGDNEVIFDVDQSIKRPTTEDDECYGIDDLDDTINQETQELLTNEEPDSFLSRGLEKSIDQSDLEYCESASNNRNNEYDPENSIRCIDSDNTPYPVTRGTTKHDDIKSEHLYSASANEIDGKKPELKSLPQHLEYAYLHGDKSFPVIISSKLSEKEIMSFLQVLEKRKGAVAWKMSNIKGISPSYYTHKILMEDDFKLVIQPQRRINPKVQDVVKNEIMKLLDSGLIYPISDSSWLQDGEWFFQIPIAPEDQEKTIFTCPYGTFAYRRMPFGLCNAPATFQRCMTAIFHDMVEDFMEVFLDDFSEKCHFMVKEGIVLGHKISGVGIEVNRAKINVIAKLPYPTNVKGVGSFLGHAGFYRRFIKDFSMISKPMNQLLMKDAKFDFSDDYKKAFNILKEKLTTAPIIISPDWNVPFELMCDASDFVVGAVLGPRIDGNKQDAKPRLIRWVLLLQGFDVEIKDKKGAENLAANHLSRLENPDLGMFAVEEITNKFPDEHLMILKAELNNDEPWYADYTNWGHHNASITGRKVYESGFYWPNIFKDAKNYVMRCDACQRSGNISSRSEMLQNNIQDLKNEKSMNIVGELTNLEIFKCWSFENLKAAVQHTILLINATWKIY
ncbi:reverse transcriptase domain-containing protein [Tanacetum coccineum]